MSSTVLVDSSASSSTPQSAPPPTNTSHNTDNATADDAGKKKKTTKRRKVTSACLYCRRSHMTCDEGRPCQRCIKREIGHLCHDEQRPKAGASNVNAEKSSTPSASNSGSAGSDRNRAAFSGIVPAGQLYGNNPNTWTVNGSNTNGAPRTSFIYQPETLGNEFSVLTDFLETLDERSFFTTPQTLMSTPLASTPFPSTSSTADLTDAATTAFNSQPQPVTAATSGTGANSNSEPPPVVLPAATKAEKFLLTAADQEPGSRNERLNRVIRSKYEAGLLKPYNYVKGYARLSRWMDKNVSQESKQQILQPLSVLRPKFRAVAQSLKDIDLVFIEEAFERLLLDYDRVFSAMGVPACLWRRTGEIYKANREFSELVGVDGFMMRDGRLGIYELMAEESAVNYWQKYGHVAFNSSQKAVLTTCVLRYKPSLNPNPATPSKTPGGTAEEEETSAQEEGLINCCFSFTIRRDKWGVPSMIVGNFIKC